MNLDDLDDERRFGEILRAALPPLPVDFNPARSRCSSGIAPALMPEEPKKCFAFTRLDPSEIPGIKARI